MAEAELQKLSVPPVPYAGWENDWPSKTAAEQHKAWSQYIWARAPAPPLLLGLPDGKEIAGIIGSAAGSMIRFYSEPENAAMLTGIFLTEGFLLAIAPKTRFIPSVIMGICGGLMAREAYKTARDIREIAKVAKDASHPA